MTSRRSVAARSVLLVCSAAVVRMRAIRVNSAGGAGTGPLPEVSVRMSPAT